MKPLLIAAIALLQVAPGCAAPAGREAKGESRSQSTMEKRVLATTKPVPLGGAPTRTALAPAAKNETLAARAASLKKGRRLYLLIRGLHVEEDPGVIYQIYLDLPPRANPAAHASRYVGDINFYGVPPGKDPDRVFYSFDITGAVRALRTKRQLPDATTVTFVPAGQAVPGAKVTIARVEVIEQ